jgi:RTA1 like protein
MEIVGYICRSLSAKKDPYNTTYFVLAYFFIVIAPVFITASVYVCLNKLIGWATSAGHKNGTINRLRPRAILWGFVACDVVSTVIQVAGAASIGKAESDRKDPTTSNDVLLAGLAFQCFAFLNFFIILGLFVLSLAGRQGNGLVGMRRFIVSLIIASLLVFLRLLFRLAETAQGVFGYLMEHEAFFGALEFAPVVVAVLMLAIWHPGRWLPLKRSTFHAKEGAFQESNVSGGIIGGGEG